MAQANEMVKDDTYLRMLIVDDDPVGRLELCRMLAPYGSADIAENGEMALDAFDRAMRSGFPYDFICLDMSKESNDLEILQRIRTIEMQKGIHGLDSVKVLLTAAPIIDCSGKPIVKSGCEGYLRKPINESKVIKMLKTLNFDKKIFKRIEEDLL